MKTINTILLTAGISILGSMGAQANLLSEAASMNAKKACDVKANGVKKVLAIAAKYNPEAVKLGVEFKRLGITNSNYIKTTEAASKAGKKEVVLEYKSKGKVKKQKMSTDRAAWRACTFAVRALQVKDEAGKTWRLSVPGDGFKY